MKPFFTIYLLLLCILCFGQTVSPSPQQDIDKSSTPAGELEWHGQKITVRKALKVPTEVPDIYYQITLLNKAGDRAERLFTIEKTVQLDKADALYLLCEQDRQKGGHITYSYGFYSDAISSADIQKALLMVLDKKIKPAAVSYPGKEVYK